MAEKLMQVVVRGKQSQWVFDFYADPKYLKDWRDDGLEVNEVCNTIPEWVVNAGLVRPYVFMQDIFNFKNPFA